MKETSDGFPRQQADCCKGSVKLSRNFRPSIEPRGIFDSRLRDFRLAAALARFSAGDKHRKDFFERGFSIASVIFDLVNSAASLRSALKRAIFDERRG
jgi:hypothetical protein